MFWWLFWWLDHKPPTKPVSPKVRRMQEITMILTTFDLQPVVDAAGDFKERVVTWKIDNGTEGGPLTYVKEALNAVDGDGNPTPVQIEIAAPRQAIIIITQEDYDNSGNFSTDVFSYTVIDNIAPAAPLSPVPSKIVEVPD